MMRMLKETDLEVSELAQMFERMTISDSDAGDNA
jgi:hypothetical protein